MDHGCSQFICSFHYPGFPPGESGTLFAAVAYTGWEGGMQMAYSDRELLARLIACEAGGEGDRKSVV